MPENTACVSARDTCSSCDLVSSFFFFLGRRIPDNLRAIQEFQGVFIKGQAQK